jgi:ribosomal 50S subunit-recycling heat shock protein
MRLDLFLKASRICPRRTVAQELCDKGLVLVNGVKGKSSHTVKVGDEVTVRRRDKQTVIKVTSLPDTRQVSKKEAGALYELLSEDTLE